MSKQEINEVAKRMVKEFNQKSHLETVRREQARKIATLKVMRRPHYSVQ